MALNSREELIDLFTVCVNIGQPEHPYKNNPYPITKDDISLGWCRSDGPYYAKCGPAMWGGNIVQFSPSTKDLIQLPEEQLLAVITHEISHISEGTHTDGPVHNKAFWRKMAFMAWQLREDITKIQDHFQTDISEEQYITEVITEPNTFTVDRRIETVDERKQEMAELLGRKDFNPSA